MSEGKYCSKYNEYLDCAYCDDQECPKSKISDSINGEVVETFKDDLFFTIWNKMSVSLPIH